MEECYYGVCTVVAAKTLFENVEHSERQRPQHSNVGTS